YTLDPITSATLSVFGTLADLSTIGQQNYHSYGATIGVRRTLFSTINLLASVGPTVYSLQGGSDRVRPSWEVSLDGPIPITPALTLTLTTNQSIVQTIGEAQDVGQVLRQTVEARLNYT